MTPNDPYENGSDSPERSRERSGKGSKGSRQLCGKRNLRIEN